MTISIKSYLQELQQDSTHKYISLFYLHENDKIQNLDTAMQIAQITTDRLTSTIAEHKANCKKMSINITSTPENEFLTILNELKKRNKKTQENQVKNTEWEKLRAICNKKLLRENLILQNMTINDKKSQLAYDLQLEKVNYLVDEYNSI